MSSERNRRVYERFCTEVLAQGNFALLDELVDEHVVTHSPFPGQPPGRDGFRAAFAQFRAAFPDLKIEVHSLLADGDRVAGHFTVSGTHRADFMGIVATGQRVSYEEMAIVRFADGKIVEHWSVADTLAMMQALGALGGGDQAPDASAQAPAGAASNGSGKVDADRVSEFFARYAERFNRSLSGEQVDAKDVADSFTSHFIAATPNGVHSAKNGLLFRWMIPRGFAHYRKLGTTAMEIRGIDLEPLDAQHALARVHWDSHYAKPDGAHDRIAFDVTYLLHFEHGEPKIFAYITGDEERILREHGLA